MNSLKVLTVSSISIWLGAMAFFSIFVAPAAFSILDRESAGRLVGAVFPRYYVFGIVLGLIALASLAGRLFVDGPRRMSWIALGLVFLMLLLTFYTLLVLLPALDSARAAMRAAAAAPGSATSQARHFSRLHQASVILNGVTLLAGLALVCFEAIRPPE